MVKNMLERIIRVTGVENIVDILSDKLGWSDLQTLLLNVFHRKIRKLQPVTTLTNYTENRLTAISEVDPRELLQIDFELFNNLPRQFVPVELSPVGVIGLNSILTSLSSKIVLQTIRNVEVVSDPTTALAIECARRRLKSSRCATNDKSQTNIATSHRVLRLQKFDLGSGFTAHFKAFALASAGRDRGHHSLEFPALSSHLSFWLDFLTRSKNPGYKANDIAVGISNIQILEKILSAEYVNRAEVTKHTQDPLFSPFTQYSIKIPKTLESICGIRIPYQKISQEIEQLQLLEEKVICPLKEKYPYVRFFFDLERCAGMGYYRNFCFKISATNPSGTIFPLVDGGVCDWTEKLLQNQKERLLISGFGTELFARMFKV